MITASVIKMRSLIYANLVSIYDDICTQVWKYIYYQLALDIDSVQDPLFPITATDY